MLHLGFSNFEGICLRCYSLSSGYCNFVLTVIFLLLVSLVLLLSWFRVSVSVVCIISWNFVVSHRYLSYFSLPIVEFSYLFLFSQRFSSCLFIGSLSDILFFLVGIMANRCSKFIDDHYADVCLVLLFCLFLVFLVHIVFLLFFPNVLRCPCLSPRRFRSP